MEDDEKVRYTFMTAIVLFIFTGPNTELFKWITLATTLVLLIALLLFAIDGIVLNIVPDKIAKLIAWVGVLLAAVVMIIVQLAGALDIILP